MFYNAQNHRVDIDGDTMNYIVFGKGEKSLIILPGLGDGLVPVHGKLQAITLVLSFKIFAQHFKVYMFSRKNNIVKNYSTKDMAEDQARVMKALNIEKANIMGVSQGGMIAQHLAIHYPCMVEKLVLAVTTSQPNEMIQKVVSNWIKLAKKGNYKELMIDTAEKSYSENFLKKYRRLYPLLTKMSKPKNFDRFIIQAFSCIQHDTYSELEKLECPTMIIGGAKDKIVGGEASEQMAAKIKDCNIFMYKDLGHGAYEEAKDFNMRVLKFLLNE